MRKFKATSLVVLAVSVLLAPERFQAKPLTSNQPAQLSVEVFQVLDLPLIVHEAALVKVDRGYVLKLSLGNSSELRMMGLRYSLVVLNYANKARPVANRTEGFSLPAYGTKTLTLKSAIRLRPEDGDRFVLMLEQVVSSESIWEVVNAKESLEAYANGDYSVMPTVLRMANQVDAPPARPRVIYQQY